MSEKIEIKHPKICFGISRHNVIIPLKIVDVHDYNDGCFLYSFAINHPQPNDYIICHQKADFESKMVSKDSPLCDEFTKIRLTLKEAKDLITKNLIADRKSAMMKINAIDKQLAEIDNSILELEKVVEK